MVPRRKDEIPVLWDDLDFDEPSTRIVLSEKFSGTFCARPRPQELSVADFETVRILRRETSPGHAFERFFEEEDLETLARPRPAQLQRVPRLVSAPPPPILAPTWGRPIDPHATTSRAFVPAPVEARPVAAPPRRRRSLIPWATLFMGVIVGASLFSDAAKAGHVRRLIDIVAAFVDPALKR
jgi:hypothetical protein